MARVMVMPRLGVTMREGMMVRWLKQVGDTVDVGEPIFEVQTDKVVMEAESLYKGVILEILVRPDETVAVGVPVAVIGKAGEAYDLKTLTGIP